MAVMRLTPFLALGLIGTGLWFVWPPLSLVVVGGLLWVDGYIGRGGSHGTDS